MMFSKSVDLKVVTQLYYFHFKSYILIFYTILVYTFYFQKMILVCHFFIVILKIPFKTIYIKKILGIEQMLFICNKNWADGVEEGKAGETAVRCWSVAAS